MSGINVQGYKVKPARCARGRRSHGTLSRNDRKIDRVSLRSQHRTRTCSVLNPSYTNWKWRNFKPDIYGAGSIL